MNKKENAKHLGKRSGFTLIELILVIVIISILSGIMLKGLNISGQSENARIADAKATIATLTGALELYEIKNGQYPSSLEGLLDESKGGPFTRMKIIPKDPWDNPYIYAAPGSHNTHNFDLSCTSKKEGKVINNWGEE